MADNLGAALTRLTRGILPRLNRAPAATTREAPPPADKPRPGTAPTQPAQRTLPHLNRTPAAANPEAPPPAQRTTTRPNPTSASTGRAAAPLLVNSVLVGATSAPYWTFSNSRLAEAGLSPVAATWCWAAIGVAGLLGGLAGRAAGRTGLRNANLAAWTLAAAGIALLALPRPGIAAALLSSALFGASYMALTGLCILWAARVFPARPARGVTWSFAGLGAGQTAASPIAGAAGSAVGLAAVFGLTGLAALLAWGQLTPRLAPPSS